MVWGQGSTGPSQTLGFTEVERIGTVPSGNYCLKAPGLSPDNRLALVSVDAERTEIPVSFASAMTFSGACTNNRFVVITKRAVLAGGNLEDEVADDVAFAIAVL